MTRFFEFSIRYRQQSSHHSKRCQKQTKNNFVWKRHDECAFRSMKTIVLNEFSITITSTVEFKKKFRDVQKFVIWFILQNYSLIVVVMNIDDNKSLLFVLFVLCEFAKINIVVVSLIFLKKNFKIRCEKTNFRCFEWNIQRSSNVVNIVFVIFESTINVDFRIFLNRLRNAQRLNRIYIDECHVILNDLKIYRKKLQQLNEFIETKTRLILLIAILSFNKKFMFWNRMHFKIDEIHLFRTFIFKINVRYEVVDDLNDKKKNQTKFLFQFVQRKRRFWLDDKIFVYCNFVNKCDIVIERLKCVVYHNRVKNKTKNLQQFKHESSFIIVVTSFLNLKFDVFNVWVIFHVDRFRNLIDYV